MLVILSHGESVIPNFLSLWKLWKTFRVWLTFQKYYFLSYDNLDPLTPEGQEKFKGYNINDVWAEPQS